MKYFTEITDNRFYEGNKNTSYNLSQAYTNHSYEIENSYLTQTTDTVLYSYTGTDYTITTDTISIGFDSSMAYSSANTDLYTLNVLFEGDNGGISTLPNGEINSFTHTAEIVNCSFNDIISYSYDSIEPFTASISNTGTDYSLTTGEIERMIINTEDCSTFNTITSVSATSYIETLTTFDGNIKSYTTTSEWNDKAITVYPYSTTTADITLYKTYTLTSFGSYAAHTANTFGVSYLLTGSIANMYDSVFRVSLTESVSNNSPYGFEYDGNARTFTITGTNGACFSKTQPVNRTYYGSHSESFSKTADSTASFVITRKSTYSGENGYGPWFMWNRYNGGVSYVYGTQTFSIIPSGVVYTNTYCEGKEPNIGLFEPGEITCSVKGDKIHGFTTEATTNYFYWETISSNSFIATTLGFIDTVSTTSIISRVLPTLS